MQQAAVLALQPPEKNDLSILKYWLESPYFGNNFLRGREYGTWHDEGLRPDLVTLRPRSENDKRFSKKATDFLIQRLLVPLFGRHYLGRDATIDGLVDYSSSSLLLFMQVLTAIMSSLC
jgi:hypothetical protein